RLVQGRDHPVPPVERPSDGCSDAGYAFAACDLLDHVVQAREPLVQSGRRFCTQPLQHAPRLVGRRNHQLGPADVESYVDRWHTGCWYHPSASSLPAEAEADNQRKAASGAWGMPEAACRLLSRKARYRVVNLPYRAGTVRLETVPSAILAAVFATVGR